MASQKVPNTALRCILRHCDMPYVCRIPQDSESRELAYLRALSLCLFA